MYRELSQKETPPASTSTTGPLEGVAGVVEVASSNNTTQPREGLTIAPQYKVFGLINNLVDTYASVLS